MIPIIILINLLLECFISGCYHILLLHKFGLYRVWRRCTGVSSGAEQQEQLLRRTHKTLRGQEKGNWHCDLWRTVWKGILEKGVANFIAF